MSWACESFAGQAGPQGAELAALGSYQDWKRGGVRKEENGYAITSREAPSCSAASSMSAVA